MNIERRVERAEKLVGVSEENRPEIIISLEPSDDETLPHLPEPIAEWITLQRAREESQRRRVPCIFTADPFAEYELRHGLEPGTLAKHQLRGEVPFAELLAVATGQTPDQGEQPCED